MEKSTLDDIRERLKGVENELAGELDELIQRNRDKFRYTVSARRVQFDAGMRKLHRSYRTGLIAYLRTAPLGYILTAPVTYALLVPLAVLDLFVTVFQQVSFRVYGIARVRRRDYVVIDRHSLSYLNAVEKLNCVYCGYANGLIAYCREVAVRTEQFWCPIKHASKARDAHQRHADFLNFGDAEAYRADLPKIRAKLLD